MLPDAQAKLWPKLGDIPEPFVLYGGMALALRLAHRGSVHFDFFAHDPFSARELLDELRWHRLADVIGYATTIFDRQLEFPNRSSCGRSSGSGTAPLATCLLTSGASWRWPCATSPSPTSRSSSPIGRRSRPESLPHHRPALAPSSARSSSSCLSCSGIPDVDPEAMAASSASFEG